MKRYEVAVLPGDGIGPEIMDATLPVLEAVADGFALSFTTCPISAAAYRKTGVALSAEQLAACRQADAVLLAALGLPDVRRPDGTEVQPEMMMGLRQGLGLYAAVRPIKHYPGAPTALADPGAGIDFVVLRENLEGLFASYDGGSVVNDEVGTNTLVVTRTGTRRIAEHAFRFAERRRGRPLDGRKVVTCVDKANVFRSYAFFRKVFFEVAAEHPAVAAETAYVDAMSLLMVLNPSHYDVLVMENLLGDILSDLGAALVGGLGLAPSAEVGAEHGLFQPSHGSAPLLAGRDLANPLAMILSAGMMLDWLGERHQDPAASAAAARVERAVARVLADGRVRTPDLGGQAGTKAVGAAVAAALGCV